MTDGITPYQEQEAAGGLVTMQSVEQIRQNVALIQRLMKEVLRKGTHYDVIPGTGGGREDKERNSLLKPGAEKLALLFRLGVSYREIVKDLPDGHREYDLVCLLTDRSTGRVIGEGLGTASTMESKYRYRWTNTGEDVPAEYWGTRDKNLLGGTSYEARKAWSGEGKERRQSWKIFQKVEHPDPADYYNTCRKMAAKRALVHAVITATAAGDIFDQDIEEGEEHGGAPAHDAAAERRAEQVQVAKDMKAATERAEAAAGEKPLGPTPEAAKTVKKTALPTSDATDPDRMINEDESKTLFVIAKVKVGPGGSGWNDVLKPVLGKFNIPHTSKIPLKLLPKITQAVQDYQLNEPGSEG